MAVSMDRWKRKVAVVTGASAGIGEAIATKLVEAGMKVVGIARGKDALDNVGHKLKAHLGKFYPYVADVSKEEDILRAFEWTRHTLGPVHILVNNAGVVRPTTLAEGDTEEWRTILDVNVLGLSIATREAIKDMKANNIDGHIVHISSVSGHYVQKIPNMNMYPASKHAVTALTETLRQELVAMGSKIKISSVSPGVVATDIAVHNNWNLETDFQFDDLPTLASEDVADAVIYVLSTPPHVQVHDIMIRPVGEKH